MMSKKKICGPGCNPTEGKDGSYRVGYRKPPLHTRWPKNQSGNPDGRLKGSLNLKTVGRMLAEELDELVSVKGSDGKRKMSKQRAFLKGMINDALTGSARDKKILLEAIAKLAEPHAPAKEGACHEAIEGGADTLERYVQRVIRRQDLKDRASAGDDDDGGSTS